jgi:hypothetical protein
LPTCETGNRSRRADLEQLGKLLGRRGSAEKVSLRFMTLVGMKKSRLFLSFDTLGNDSQV